MNERGTALRNAIEAAARRIVEHADELTALDQAIGDGDHGINMKRGAEEVLAKLRDGLMEMSRQRAKENIELIRELGRRKTKDFFQKWLSGTYSNGADYQVEVIFRDELPPGTIRERVRPEF